MRRAELDRVYTLRRRRLVALCLLAPFFLAGLAQDGWHLSPVWALFDDDEGTFAAGDPFDEWIYAVCDGERQQVAVLRDGRLAGVEGLASLRTARFPNWCDLPVVNNPELPSWQAQLSRLRALTATPGSSAREILDVARQMPVSALYLKPISEWIHEDYSNAVGFLDAVAERPMEFDHPNPGIVRARRDNFSRLIGDALDEVALHGDAPARLTAWLGERQIVGRGRSLRKLAGMDGLDDDARAALLKRLESVPVSERGELYAALSPHLARDGQYAALLTEQLRLVPTQTRLVAARKLLTQPDASVQFPIALLSDSLHAFHGADVRLDVFVAIADALKNEGEAPLLLTRHLKDLPGIQRRLAATHLLSLDRPGETAFALGVLRSFSDLHPLSRPKVVYALMQSEQFRDRRVQEACLLAIRLELSGRDRQELLSTMLNHQALDDELYARIRAEFG